MAKILLVSSAGGHFSELQQLSLLANNHQLIYVSEDKIKNNQVDYYLKYGSRAKLFNYFKISLINTKRTWQILTKEQPDIIISTGAHSCVTFFWIAKFKKIKTIYIESYAKVNSPSLTYKLIKPVCNQVIVQHQKMLEVYPEAKYLGGLF